uniref:Essential protein Yae1 N-terminal domain-containing protein n=1 Tax=Arundo donax TaxID=35708 RepID=A0A0A8YZL3_ARUDO
MDQRPKDDADFLEPSVLLDETHYQEGYRNGYHDGLASGKEEGRQVGLKMGFQVGEELGFYQGCLDVWTSAIRIGQEAFSTRVRKNIEQLATLVSSYPLSEPENEQVQDKMEKIRLKFRVITASLGVKLEYEGRPASSKEDVEDL